MNSTSSLKNSPQISSNNNIGGFGYGIGVSIGILILVTTITLASYFCTRAPPPPAQQRRRSRRRGSEAEDLREIVMEVGLDEATLKSYPEVVYSKANLSKTKDSTTVCCSICLADYKGSDKLRILPDCGHVFHVKCVDPWLRLHPTCPVCRTSPMPSPQPTPLAEVTPLASSRS